MSSLQQPEYFFDLLTDSVMIRTMDGRIGSWNRSAAEFYGWRKEEAIGQISHSLLQTQFPQPLEEIESELVQNGLWVGKLVHTTRNGGRVVVTSRWILDRSGRTREVFEINGSLTANEISAVPNGHPPGTSGHDSKPLRSAKFNDGLLKIANIVLIAGALLSTLVFLYFFYYYGWTEQLEFTTPIGAALYYGLPLMFASILGLSLRFKASDKINILLVLMSVIVAAYAVELALVTIGSSASVPTTQVMSDLLASDNKSAFAATLRDQFGVDVDSRSASEAMTALQAKGDDVVPFISPRNNLFTKQDDGTIKSALSLNGAELLPLAGISKKTTLLCNENGPWVTYKSDRYGFNNPDDLWEPGRAEIAALGDSFTHGYCVPSENSFVGLIRQRYPATLNLGIAGDGPLLTLATLKEYLTPLRPKTVLWFYFEGNDLTDLQNETNSALLTHFLSGDFAQGLSAQQSAIDEAIQNDFARQREVDELRRKTNEDARAGSYPVVSKLTEFAKLSILRLRLGLDAGVFIEDRQTEAALKGPIANVFREVLWQANNRVNAWGGQLYFVYLPDWPRYAGAPGIAGQRREQVLSLVHGLGIPLIDVNPNFDAQPDPLSLFPFRRNGHYNEKGHRLVAEEVLKVLPQSQRPPG